MPVESDSPLGKQPESEEKLKAEEREVPKGRVKIVCEFCECDLFPNGELKKKSERAKRMEFAMQFAEEAAEEAKLLEKEPTKRKKEPEPDSAKKSLTDGNIVW